MPNTGLNEHIKEIASNEEDSNEEEEGGVAETVRSRSQEAREEQLLARFALVNYKDQSGEASVPIVSAVEVQNSALDEDLQLQLDEERRLRAEADEHRLQAERRLGTIQSRRKTLVLVGATLAILALAAAIGGICGSGNCSGRSSTSNEVTNLSSPRTTTTEAPSPFMPIPTTTPLSTTSEPTVGVGTEPSSISSVTTQAPVTQLTPRLPIITPAPVIAASTPRSEFIVAFINSITLSGRNLSYPNTELFAEEEALNWLVEQDLGTSEAAEMKLRQRFALATLWFKNGPFHSDHLDTWLSSIDECDWMSIVACVNGEVTIVSLWQDGLRGQLPADLGLLTAVTSLQLWDNQLSGSIPTEIGLLTDLAALALSGNQFTGNIPSEIQLLTALTNLQLFNNRLTGSIPTEIGLLTKLEALGLNTNELTGSIPSEMTLLTALTSLQLWDNRLTGSIPTEIGLLTGLTVLSMGGIRLTGSIPTEVGLLTDLVVLGFNGNQLMGSIPTEVGLLTDMTRLDLVTNQLIGTIPNELNQLNALTEFWVYNNNLSGDMPFCDGTTRPTRFAHLEADCNEVSCPCCTECCPNGGFEGIPSGFSSCDA